MIERLLRKKDFPLLARSGFRFSGFQTEADGARSIALEKNVDQKIYAAPQRQGFSMSVHEAEGTLTLRMVTRHDYLRENAPPYIVKVAVDIVARPLDGDGAFFEITDRLSSHHPDPLEDDVHSNVSTPLSAEGTQHYLAGQVMETLHNLGLEREFVRITGSRRQLERMRFMNLSQAAAAHHS